MKIIAIDYGLKRCGIAETDTSQIIASPLAAVETKNIFSYLTEYFKKNKIECMILGEPKRMDGTDTHSSDSVRKFARDLSSRFPEMKIKWVDERFTSSMAKQTILESGVSKKRRQDKGLVDEVSAAIILQSYLSGKK